VRLIFRNPGLILKPGMFVNVNISERLGRQLVVPASAVLQSGVQSIAFVDHGDGNLEPRVVQTGPQIDDSIIILSGLKPGERVVQSANFLVDSEAQLQAAMQGFSPTSAAPSTVPAATQQNVHISLITDPSPPRRGSNTLRVRITGADGQPVAGAQVSVTFYMPAMPAMGMAAMRASTSLADKGDGKYEGDLTLSSGGTWQVTVTIQRNGQTLATKHFTFDATGGMG
jgi:YtkA-like